MASSLYRFMVCTIAVLFLCAHPILADLLVAENGLKPWPSGHGEDPPPKGSLVRLDADGNRHMVKTGLIDPVWVVGSKDGESAYVGLFHSGKVVRISLRNGTTTTVTQGLSCPEGVALGYDQDTDSKEGYYLYVVENPVGDECQATFPIKKEAQLTRVDLRSGAQTKIASLRSSTGGEEGGPHGLAVQSGFAYVCDCPAHGASLTRVELGSGTKTVIANLTSPSGCAVGDGHAYVVEQGSLDGQLVQVTLPDNSRSSIATKKILLKNLAGPMGVAVDTSTNVVYVEERHKNRVLGFNLTTGSADIFATGLNSPIGLSVVHL